MKRFSRALLRAISPRVLGLAFLFGLCSVTVIAVGLTLQIPGTPIFTDVGGVFATIGGALTGPVGGALIGVMTGLMDPTPGLKLYVIAERVLAGLWMGSTYWIILRRFRSTGRFLVGWVLLVLGFYFVARIPALVGLKYLSPPSFTVLSAGSESILKTLYTIDKELLPEAAVVSALTSIALLVFPSAFRMPVWRSGQEYRHYLQYRLRGRSFAFPRTLSVRLTVWLLLLSLLPVMVLSVFVWSDVTTIVDHQAGQRDAELAEDLAATLAARGDADAVSVLKPFNTSPQHSVWIIDRDGYLLYHPNATFIGMSAFRFFDSLTVKRILNGRTGYLVDYPGGVNVGYHRLRASGSTLLVVDPHEFQALTLRAFHRSSYLKLGASMVLISIIGGVIVWILVEIPMKRLTKATTQIGRGNFSAEVRASDLDDDIAVLGDRFNVMVRNLRSLRDGLEKEIKVRRDIEQQLRESEAKYRTIIEQSSEGILLADSQGSVIECNRADEQILGIPRADILGKKTWELFQPHQEKGVHNGAGGDAVERAPVNGLYTGVSGFGRTTEVTVARKDRRTVILQQTVFPIVTESGRRIGVILQDVTRRKENEEALRRSEEKFSRVFHTTPDSITITTLRNGKYVDVNEGFTTMTGYRPEEAIGKTSGDLDIWADKADREKLIRAVQANGEVTGLDASFRRRNGTQVYALLSAKIILIEQEECLLLIARDVTERRRAEEALRESEERFRSVFEHAAVGICYASLEGRFLRVNDAFCKITGYAEAELTRMTFDDLTATAAGATSADQITSLLADGIPSFTLTRQFEHKTGRTIWVNMTISVIRKALDQPTSFIGIIENITERKKAEEEIEKSLHEKELLLKEIHHRVKNNLQIISSLLNLQSEAIRDSGDRSLFRDSQDRIRSMALIHERLYQTEDFSHVDFQQYLRSLLASLFRSYQRPSVTCTEHIEDIRLNIDAAIPCGLIVNELVTNALKYAFPEGASGEVSVSFYRREDGQLVLEVSDDGVGMPPPDSSKEKDHLGLELVNILVNQLGGQQALLRDHGTTFQIIFSAQ
jgi:PAS domain S-box-containing protein